MHNRPKEPRREYRFPVAQNASCSVIPPFSSSSESANQPKPLWPFSPLVISMLSQPLFSCRATLYVYYMNPCLLSSLISKSIRKGTGIYHLIYYRQDILTIHNDLPSYPSPPIQSYSTPQHGKYQPHNPKNLHPALRSPCSTVSGLALTTPPAHFPHQLIVYHREISFKMLIWLLCFLTKESLVELRLIRPGLL